MRRSKRMEVAKETVAICDRGSYRTISGLNVDIGEQIRACIVGTRYFPGEKLNRLKRTALGHSSGGENTEIEVVNETTLSGLARLIADKPTSVAALNFASAKNPGGGFLNGSYAQEESLARSSALYRSLLQAPHFYDQHRASYSLLYSDAMIWSPDCPVFRNDEGDLLDEPHLASFITSAAPNAGAAGDTRPHELANIPHVLRRRAECLLALAASQGYKRLVLGAWGCGVFRNDPEIVAATFAEHLRGIWAGHFERVIFSVFDNSPRCETLRAFEKAFG